MSLSARLTVFFMAIVVVPLIVAGVFVQTLADRQARDQADATLQASGLAFGAAVRDRVDEARRLTRLVAPEAVTAKGEPRLERARQAAELDYLISLPATGPPVFVQGESAYLAGVSPPSLLGVQTPVPGSVAEGRVVIQSGGVVRGGFFLDRSMLLAFGVEGVVYSAGRPIASTLETVPDVVALRSGPLEVGEGRGLFLPLQNVPLSGVLLLAETPDRGTPILILLGLGLLVAGLIGYLLARMVARPVQRLAADAVAIARGDLELNVETEGGDEVGRLGAAFNAITHDLRRYVIELRASRDEIRRGMERLGETLSATHDLNGMLAVVLDTAAVTLGAETGAVYLRSGRRREIRARGMHGVSSSSIRLSFGEGLAGAVMAEQKALLAPADGHRPSSPEPTPPTALAVPLMRAGSVIGVLALYGRGGPRFTRDDLATLSSFAAQASVAIDNVFLHEETERLATIDPLTGAWNRRYLDATLVKEVDRAQRFARPLSVLMLDLDKFKKVNDKLGHQVGDEVLAEVSRRIQRSIRSQIDTLARFGGEEFSIVLPETGEKGARIVAEKVLNVIRAEAFDNSTPARTGASSIPRSASR
ncbi:MAG: diguanylate cyclase [Actinobacteria bacterium]|nr:diguanylate cyclase [Actinomycetota bacterium]